MLSVEARVEELVEHLQVVRVVPARFEARVLEVLAQESLPLGVLELGGHVVEDFFLLEGRLNVLLRTLLDLQRVQLLVREFKS